MQHVMLYFQARHAQAQWYVNVRFLQVLNISYNIPRRNCHEANHKQKGYNEALDPPHHSFLLALNCHPYYFLTQNDRQTLNCIKK